MKKQVLKWMLRGLAFETGILLGELLRQQCIKQKKRRFSVW